MYSKYILNPNKLNISIKNIKLKQIQFCLLLNIFLIQFYNILDQKINFYFEYMIISFSKIYDEYILRLLSRKYSSLKITLLKRRKVN